MTAQQGGTKTRFISGLIAFVVILPVLLYGGFYGVGLLVLVATGISCREFHGIALSGAPRGTLALFGTLSLFVFVIAAYSTAGGVPIFKPFLSGPAEQLLFILLVSFCVSGAWFLVMARTTERLADYWASFILGLVYVPLILGLMPALLHLDGGQGWLWVPLFIAWCGDIGGYFAGRAFGKRKLLPTISPKKTWEGFAGGLALAVFGLLLYRFVFYGPFIEATRPLDLRDCVFLGVFGSAFAVLGDLAESMIKRTHGVKDSGNFLPGHGGLLDRIDAVQFGIVVVFVWAVFVRPVLP
ncbi:MAG TPA: hypothetical protein DIU15_08575 [Deltaproteobacteria bacterium]|nr:hypothetical protein [Deltaproteobacteria bacterium]HCP46081.1 hypothetical protein [Deltaproteobacteria bacterium]